MCEVGMRQVWGRHEAGMSQAWARREAGVRHVWGRCEAGVKQVWSRYEADAQVAGISFVNMENLSQSSSLLLPCHSMKRKRQESGRKEAHRPDSYTRTQIREVPMVRGTWEHRETGDCIRIAIDSVDFTKNSIEKYTEIRTFSRAGHSHVTIVLLGLIH